MSSTLSHDPGAFDAEFEARPEALFSSFRPDAVLSGWPDFDAMAPLRPGQLTLLDAPRACDLVDRLYADAAVQGSVVLVADGANSLDAHHLATAARRRAVARMGHDAPWRDLAAHEELVLDRVRVAHGFTVHQLQAIVEDGLPREAARAKDEGLAVGLVAAPGLLDMSLDADVQPDESRVLAERAVASLRALARALDVPVLITGGILLPGTVHPLRAMLEGAVDEQVDVRETRAATLLDFPRRGARFVMPGRSQRRLNDYAPDVVGARPTPPSAKPASMGASSMNGRLFGPRYGPAASWIQGTKLFLKEPAVTAGGAERGKA